MVEKKADKKQLNSITANQKGIKCTQMVFLSQEAPFFVRTTSPWNKTGSVFYKRNLIPYEE